MKKYQYSQDVRSNFLYIFVKILSSYKLYNVGFVTNTALVKYSHLKLFQPQTSTFVGFYAIYQYKVVSDYEREGTQYLVLFRFFRGNLKGGLPHFYSGEIRSSWLPLEVTSPLHL